MRLAAIIPIVVIAELATASQSLNCADVSGLPAVAGVRFDKDVVPIFEEPALGCTNCHGSSSVVQLDQGAQSHGNLVCADTQSSAPDPAQKLVVPGDPEQSWLYLRVACEDPNDSSFRMPRSSETLLPQELRIIYDWISQGAPSAETIFNSRFETIAGCP